MFILLCQRCSLHVLLLAICCKICFNKLLYDDDYDDGDEEDYDEHDND